MDQNNQRFAKKWRQKLVADFIIEKGDITVGSAGVVQAYGSGGNGVQEAILTFARDAYL